MSHNEIKELTFEESLLFRDSNVDGHRPMLGGIVVVRESGTRKILQPAKPNLVVRNGREMTLRKIFNLPGAVAGETESQLGAKSVLLFGIGTGGTPNNDPFNPFAVTPSDKDLSSAISFRTTSAAAPFSNSDAEKYTDGRATTGGNIEWHKKLFSNGHGEITVDPLTDTVYNKLSLQITSEDARDKFVNELALFWTRYNAAALDMNSKFSDYFMFSRITFLTEPLPSSTSKGLDIDYFVYL
jgi:hypothetical protein